MGNLLRILTREEPASKSCDIFVDFENASPTDSEKQLWSKVHTVLQDGYKILNSLQSYCGASEEIRQAISNPRTEKYQERAWQVVCPLVAQLKVYYEFSSNLDNIIPELLAVLCSNEITPRQHLEAQQALFKQFAEILDFVLKFDDLKMMNPAIQNDFSYYRRTLSRLKLANVDDIQVTDVVSNEIANHMSLFYAEATPMLKTLSDSTSRFVSQHKEIPVENTTDCLSTMANICRVMIENPVYCSRFTNEETKLFCLRVMVGVIILYDHVHPVGAFTKSSSIDIKSSIKVLKEQKPSKVELLLNALRYTTKHLNDESTSKTVKAMLAN